MDLGQSQLFTSTASGGTPPFAGTCASPLPVAFLSFAFFSGGGAVFVRGGRFRSAINLDQHKPRGVVRLLEDVEAGHARFLHALARVFDGSVPERFDAFRFDMDMNEYNEHNALKFVIS
jgi:hypothetical protein